MMELKFLDDLYVVFWNASGREHTFVNIYINCLQFYWSSATMTQLCLKTQKRQEIWCWLCAFECSGSRWHVLLACFWASSHRPNNHCNLVFVGTLCSKHQVSYFTNVTNVIGFKALADSKSSLFPQFLLLFLQSNVNIQRGACLHMFLSRRLALYVGL